MAAKGKTVKKTFLEHLIIWGIILVFAILPLLYFPGRAASYVTSKQYFLIGIVDVLVVLWIWLLCIRSSYRLHKKTIFALLPLFLFLISLTVSAFVGVSPTTSFFSTVESGTGLLLLYHAFLFVCIVASFVQVHKKSFFKSIAQATLIASAILAAVTFFTGAAGVFETGSTMLDGSSGGAMMGNALLVGAYFIFSFFFAAMLLIEEENIYKKAAYILAGVVMLISPIYFNAAIWKGLPISHSSFVLGEARIATVSLVVGLIMAAGIWAVLQRNKKTLRIIGSIGIVLIVLGGIIGVVQIAKPSSRAHQFFVAQSGNRIIDWQASLQGIKQKPLLGWGPENFHVVYQQHLNPIVFSPGHGNEVWALHPHNNTLEVLVDGGVIGCLFYITVLISLFITLNILRKKNTISNASFALFTGMLIAFILQQQMIYDSIVSYTMFFTIIAIVAGLLPDQAPQGKAFSKNISYGIGIGIVVVMFPVWLYCAYWPAQKVDEFQSVATAHSDARISQYQHLFHSTGSYAIDTDAEFYTSPLFYSYSANEVQIKNNPLYLKVATQELQSLFTAVQPIWQNNPYDYHLTLSLLQLENLDYYFTGNTQALNQADSYAQRGMALSPTDPQIYVNYAQTLVYERKIAQAKSLLDKAITLNAHYQPATDFKKQLQ